jgi:hypothetical protein
MGFELKLKVMVVGITKLETNVTERSRRRRRRRLRSYMNELYYKCGSTDHPSIINTKIKEPTKPSTCASGKGYQIDQTKQEELSMALL